MENPFKILLADDHVMFRRGVRRILQGLNDVEVVGEASDGLELLRLIRELDPNLVIMDISMPNLRGLEATREIKCVDPQVKVLILTMHKDREYLYHALTAGAEGYLLKEDADGELILAIEKLRTNKPAPYKPALPMRVTSASGSFALFSLTSFSVE